MPKTVFVTGGVVSSLGKGMTTSSLAFLFDAAGLRVRVVKADPYLNVDAGTLSPYEHGEVFVLDDGTECDLDLGHYERMIRGRLDARSSLTTGSVYQTVIERERSNGYGGGTVQVVPHVTDEIRRRFRAYGDEADVTLVEIGGTVGDMEAKPFLEAMRQEIADRPHDCCAVHMALAPTLRCTSEAKTKPVQRSIADLRSDGIVPDVVVVRSESALPADAIGKIAGFLGGNPSRVFQQPDVDGNIYRLPFLTLPIVEFVSRRLGLDVSIGGERLTCLAAYADRVGGRKVRVALAGKYHGGADTYRSVEEALRHASSFLGLDLEILAAATKNDVASSSPHGVVAPGGFGRRGFEDIVEIASDCRVARRPFLGLCLGMQAAAVEAVRATGNEADSAEFVHDARVVAAWDGLGSGVARPGGPPPMRLGARAVIVASGTTLHSVYGGTGAMERHRHRYAVNPDYESVMNRAGLVVSATSAEGVIEAVEARQHPFYVGVQYHPELLSRFDCPHPLFVRFLGAASEVG